DVADHGPGLRGPAVTTGYSAMGLVDSIGNEMNVIAIALQAGLNGSAVGQHQVRGLQQFRVIPSQALLALFVDTWPGAIVVDHVDHDAGGPESPKQVRQAEIARIDPECRPGGIDSRTLEFPCQPVAVG